MSAPVLLTPEVLKRHALPDRDDGADKDARGCTLVVAGSARVPGAALLSGLAAMRAGAGKMQIAAPGSIAVALGVAFPEAGIIALPEGDTGEPSPDAARSLSDVIQAADAVLIGPGWMDPDNAKALTMQLLQLPAEAMFVVDGLAIVGLADQAPRLRARGVPVLLTPHCGEMAALLGVDRREVEADPLSHARRAARDGNAIVVLKGSTTYVVSPNGDAWRHDGGVPGLATSGSGDTLAGLMAGLIARGTPPVDAALWAVFIHAQAGRRLTASVGPLGFLARELLPEIPKLLVEYG